MYVLAKNICFVSFANWKHTHFSYIKIYGIYRALIGSKFLRNDHFDSVLIEYSIMFKKRIALTITLRNVNTGTVVPPQNMTVLIAIRQTILWQLYRKVDHFRFMQHIFLFLKQSSFLDQSPWKFVDEIDTWLK